MNDEELRKLAHRVERIETLLAMMALQMYGAYPIDFDQNESRRKIQLLAIELLGLKPKMTV